MDLRKYSYPKKMDRINKIREYQKLNPGCTQNTVIAYLIENENFVKQHWRD